MDITMFFAFPGILITIGTVLLLLSIVLLIIAFKTNDNSIEEIKANDINGDIVVSTEIKNTDSKTNNKQENNKQNKKDSDEGFDLTKVFEISEDKGMIEKEINSKKEVVVKDNNEQDTTEKNEENKQNDEEIELL